MKQAIVETILQEKIVAIARLENYSRALDIARALAAGGVSILEFPLNGRGAMEAVSAVRQELGDAVIVGAGSVLNTDDANALIDAGAQFVVTPAVRRDVIAACINRATPILCGGFSPTELLEAYEAGSDLVKLFPAQFGGPRYLADMLAPMPFLRLVPTGGVNPENARAYLDAGAVALGVGGNLISKKAVAAGAFEDITAAAKTITAAIH